MQNEKQSKKNMNVGGDKHANGLLEMQENSLKKRPTQKLVFILLKNIKLSK
ncbi:MULTISPECIES: hypothetical protein [16SrI (Aster yellows group)]|uniref:Uncharacterized protein n=2 Tax=16SrI (Aster yellows group) TaxID=3042590 RepID=A0A859I8Z7_9MOLU|nr:hypothetical protein [Chrysanthemum yellows phytoplasma]QKX95103.1 MAG: hypothetical protein RP166_0900 [Rapeseed phyllody phytoplasma]